MNHPSLPAIIANIFFTDSESDSESESEEEDVFLEIAADIMVYLTRGPIQLQPRIENYVERVIPNYTSLAFKSHFRMLPSTFEETLRLIGPALTDTKYVSGRKPIPANKQLLIALWYMATPDSYRSVCEKFNVGRATGLRALRRVTYSLHCLAPHIIVWPKDDEALRIKNAFKAKKDFPGIVGAIDGCHINIQAPREDPRSYVNRKGNHSIHLQACCDDRMVFTDCLAGNVGSINDARVLKTSPLVAKLENPEEFFPGDSHLVGDGGYFIHPCLMIPYRDNGALTERQINFNQSLSNARQVIERAFGLLKGRFRSLLDCNPLTRQDKIPEFIMACCVLHNICTLRNDFLSEEIVDLQEDREQHNFMVEDPMRKALGRAKRDRIINALPLVQN